VTIGFLRAFRAILMQGRLVLMAALLLLSASCAELHTMRTDVADLKQDSYDNKKEMARLKTSVESLEKAVAEASGPADDDSLAALRQSQASLYAQVSDTVQEMQNVQGRFEENKFFVDRELKRIAAELEVIQSKLATAPGAEPTSELRDRVEGLEGDVALLKAKLAAVEASPSREGARPSLKASPEDMYEDAYRSFQAKQYEEAREKMQEVIQTYPRHPLTGNAQFWVGETYYNQKDFENAILAYEDVILKYQDNQKVPAAMLKQAYAFSNIGENKAAEGILRELIARYPKADVAEKAREKLDALK
jgi:tol-pal system protein YbgF